MDFTPQHIRILNADYTVKYQKEPLEITAGGVVLGNINYWERRIDVAEVGRSDRDVMQTLWHEVMHALCEQLYIEIDGHPLIEDEVAIDLLATGIVSVLMDNNGAV